MYQEDMHIIDKSHITGDVLVINQANRNKAEVRTSEERTARMYSTTERGLSNSRNMALKYANGDICVLCDDDEIFESDYQKTISEAFRELQHADVIAFNLTNHKPRLKQKTQRIRQLKSLKLASYHLAFYRDSIINAGIQFDPLMGSGSNNGCGEENKFLLDCLKKKLHIYYVPKSIATLESKQSKWFFGFDETFFYQRGAATRYMLGFFLAVIYGIYYILAKYSLYQDSLSPLQASKNLFRGLLDNPIKKEKSL